jgi:hypothetical protein
MPMPMVLNDPADILSLVPFVLGFHPTDSVVVLGLRGRQMIFQARGDLADAVPLAGHYATIVGRQQVTAVIVIGYGPATSVTPAVLAIAARLAETGADVRDVLRVTDGRYWSYLCQSWRCCPADGTPFDPTMSRVAAAAVVEGHVALPSREALERRLAPIGGLAREGMREATGRAHRRIVTLIESAAAPVDAAPVDAAPADVAGRLRAAGATAVRAAVDRQRTSDQLDDDEVAWLTVLLVHLSVRDDAWGAIDADPALHVRLWTEVLRRAEPELSPAPATLLGFAAWQAGDGVIAAMAVDRALAADPDYAPARLLGEVIAGGVPPQEWAAARRRLRARTG